MSHLGAKKDLCHSDDNVEKVRIEGFYKDWLTFYRDRDRHQEGERDLKVRRRKDARTENIFLQPH